MANLRWLFSWAGLLVVASSCTQKKAPDAGVQTVQAGLVEEIQPDTPEKYSAVVLPNLQVDLAFKSAGLIVEVHRVRGADGRIRDVEAGDLVSAGTILASVRPNDYQQRLDQGQAGVAQAEAQLAQARASFSDADREFNRAKNLYASASLTKPDYDRAQAQYESSAAQVKAAQAAIESARTQANQANLALEDTLLRAPFTGYVIARNVSKGSLVGNSTVGFSLIDTHVVKAEFAVPDTSLRGVHLGQRLAMNLDALPQPVEGVLTAISPQADAKSRVFSVELTVPNANGAIRPGMIGSLSITTATHPLSRIVIPLSAVVRAPGSSQGFGVYRIENRNGKTYAVAQPIQIGSTYGNAIEVTSGIGKGEHIVALGGELLQNEQEIRVVQ